MPHSTIQLKEALTRHMHFQGWDKKTLAMNAGLTQATISDIFNRKNYSPSAETCEKLRKALKLNTFTDIHIDPFSSVSAHTLSAKEVDLMEILRGLENDPNIVINGKPLNEKQREAWGMAIRIVRLST